MELIIAKLYRLASIKNRYSLDHKEIDRPKAIVERQYAEANNENYINTGLWYEIDEKATNEWKQKLEDKKQIAEQRKELKQAANAAILSDAINKVIEQKIKK